MAHNNHRCVIVRSKFDNEYRILGGKCFESYSAAKEWCKEQFPDLSANDESIEKNFSIRCVTGRKASRVAILVALNAIENKEEYQLVLSLAKSAFLDDKEIQDLCKTGCSERKEVVRW